ncbi:MAG: hypothetical protein ACOVQA_14150 [Thermoflexibacteraceae bacterium]
MKTLALIFAMAISLNQVTFANHDSTKVANKNLVHTTKVQITSTFLNDLIEADALLERDVELFETKISKTFLQDAIERNAVLEDQNYISDFRNFCMSPNFLQAVIEENADRAK